jgi:hypothetical protein
MEITTGAVALLVAAYTIVAVASRATAPGLRVAATWLRGGGRVGRLGAVRKEGGGGAAGILAIAALQVWWLTAVMTRCSHLQFQEIILWRRAGARLRDHRVSTLH